MWLSVVLFQDVDSTLIRMLHVCRVEIEERLVKLKLMERQLSEKEKELVEVRNGVLLA